MSNDTVITVVGNLTSDPNLRYTNSGAAVVDFTLASTPRLFDRNLNEWKDGETLFLRCSAWRDYAENIAESLHKGDRAIVQGRLVQRSYTPRDGGDPRRVVELQVDDVGPVLRYATAQITRRRASQPNQFQSRQAGQQVSEPAQPPADDGWADRAPDAEAPF